MPKDLKKTVLNAWHKANGGQMVEFAGWEMPVSYPRLPCALQDIRAYQQGDQTPEKNHLHGRYARQQLHKQVHQAETGHGQQHVSNAGCEEASHHREAKVGEKCGFSGLQTAPTTTFFQETNLPMKGRN